MAKRKQQENSSGLLDIVVDIGNSLWKVMIQGRPSTACVFPHSIKYISERKFASEGKRFEKGYQELHDIDFGTFAYRYKVKGGWDTAYVSAGSTAENKETEGIKVGAEKYIRQYYGVALTYLLLQMFPDGCDNPIRLTVGHPASDIEYRDAMIDSVIGNHFVKLLNGEKIKFVIKSVIPYEEGVAAGRNFVYTRDGIHYRQMSQQFNEGLGLDINIGGGISSVTPYSPQTGWVDYGNSTSIGSGINDIMKSIGSDILQEYAQSFTDNKDGNLALDARMRMTVKTGKYWQNGYNLDVAHIVKDSTRVFRNNLRTAIITAGGVGRFRFITISGGGGGYMWKSLMDNDTLNFNPDFIFPALDSDGVVKEDLEHMMLEEMHYSVLFGADKTTSAKIYKISQESKPKRRRR